MKCVGWYIEPHLNNIPKVPGIYHCAFVAKSKISKIADTGTSCDINLLPNNVEMCCWCLHIKVSHIQEIDSGQHDLQSSIIEIINRNKTNIATHFSPLWQYIKKETFCSHSETETNQRNQHLVRICELITNSVFAIAGLIIAKHQTTCRSQYVHSTGILVCGLRDNNHIRAYRVFLQQRRFIGANQEQKIILKNKKINLNYLNY